MLLTNSYSPSQPVIGSDTESPDNYDLNCCIPVPAKLETDRVLLVPFIPSLHAKLFYDSWSPYLDEYPPVSIPTYESFLDLIENVFRRDPGATMFATIDKTKPADPGSNLPGVIAGILGYLHISPANLSLEIGPVITLPAFQRTFVTTHATSLLLKHALDLPNDGGLGFRRVVWLANTNNVPSIVLAERMGFKKEGTLRYDWVLPEGKQRSEQWTP